MVGVHRVVIGRRRGEAVRPNVADEFAAKINGWCTSRGYRAPPPPPTGAQDKIGFGWAEKTGTLEAKTGTQNNDFWSGVARGAHHGSQSVSFLYHKLMSMRGW